MFKFLFAVFGAALTISGSQALAQGTVSPAARPASTSTASTADPFAQAMAARSVAEFARRQKDPAAMLTAARMLQEIPGMGSDGGAATFSTAGLFNEARTLAKGDTMLLAQIRVAESTGSRGVSSSAFGAGLVRVVQAVNGRGAYQFTVNAKANEPLRIGAIGDVGTSLLMKLQDPSGHTVCLDDHGDYAPVCQVKPNAPGRYRVDIQNKSAQTSRAVILSN